MKKILVKIKQFFSKESTICATLADNLDISKKQAQALIEGFLIIDGTIFFLKINNDGYVDGVMTDFSWTGGHQDKGVTLARDMVVDKDEIDFYKKELHKRLNSSYSVDIVIAHNKFKQKYKCLSCFL